MDLIVTKWIAMEGTSLIAKEKEEELVKIFPKQMVAAAAQLDEYIDTASEAGIVSRFGMSVLQELGEGGIFTALWMLAEGLHLGFEVELRKIPVKQEVIELCEYLDLNPYNMLSGGCLLIAAENGLELVSELKRESIPAEVIGRTVKGNDKLILNGEHRRYLDRPQREELYKIYKKGWKDL